MKDKNGDPYMVPNTAFNVGMLDLTHPKTATWFKQVLREMVDNGVRGWMADFGEGLPVDAVLYSGFFLIIFLKLLEISSTDFSDPWEPVITKEKGKDNIARPLLLLHV